MRSRLLILLVLVAVGIAAWALAPPVDPPTAHDRAMARFARSLRRVPLDDVVVDQGVAFGLLWGNGNHCDARGWLVVDSTLAPDAFVAALPQEVALAWAFSPDRPRDPRSVFEIFEIAGAGAPQSTPEVLPWEADRAIEAIRAAVSGLDAPAPGRRRYLLQTTEQAIDDWDLGDFRCH